MEQVKCENLTLGYNGIPLFSNLSFSISKGDYLCVIGENGSGKTTLMKAILGMKSPMSGSITYDEGVKGREIGYLPQQTDVQKDFPASVWEIVLSGCQSRKGKMPWYSKDDKKIARENIRRLEIEKLINRCYSDLSGGQQQRVLLARALCATKKILLLDEPVTGLDPNATKEMYQILNDLNNQGITIIMISHDVEAALEYSDHILFLGKETFFGTKREYIDFAKNLYKWESDKLRLEEESGEIDV